VKKPTKAKPKKIKSEPEVTNVVGIRSLVDRIARAPYIQKYVTKIAIATEVARLVREIEKDPEKREVMYFKLIESLDFSDAWLNSASKAKISDLYNDLRDDNWNDIKNELEEYESGGE